MLASAKRPISRATLVEMFWGDQDDARARHSLSDALSHLRRVLGRRAIETHGTEIALSREAPLVIDAMQFADAVESGDVALASRLYSGGFLDGVEPDTASGFDHWVTRERRRLESLFLQVCAKQCMAQARAREWNDCADLAARWLDAAPLSADAALFRLNALKAPGTRAAAERALDEYAHLVTRLDREFEAQPEKAVRQLADSIRESLASLPVESVAVPPRATANTEIPVTPNDQVIEAAHQDVPGPKPAREARDQSRVFRLLSSAAAALALVVAIGARQVNGAHEDPHRPRIAVVIDAPAGDSALAWLADGLPQMIVSRLTRSPEVDVVAAARVRALMRRRGPTTVSRASDRELSDVAKRLGATLLVAGSIGRDDDKLVLDLTVHDGPTGRLLRNDALARTNAVVLADEAAARVLATVKAEEPGLRVADIETSSVDAYQHFVRAMNAAQEWRGEAMVRELDAAIALDSGFVSAVHARLDFAVSHLDDETAARLRDVLSRNRHRATDFDRLRSAAYDAATSGEFERGEAIGRQLVRRFPRDPRSYGVLNDVLGGRGQFAEAEEMWERRLALDSLTMEAGSGPCAPCGAYGALTRVRAQQGKWAEAEASARRWVALQPDAPASWATLATVLIYTQRDSAALDAMRRAESLSDGDPGSADHLGRLLVMARQYDAADSLIATWLDGGSPQMRLSAHDLRALLLRERGQLRASNVAIDRGLRESSRDLSAAGLLRGSNFARLGEYPTAIRVYEQSIHGPRLGASPFPPSGGAARGYCWHHALLADAIAPTGDVVRLRAIADTLEQGCARSFYGRDRLLYHHVRGLVAMEEGRWLEAAAELRQAKWGVAESWTRSTVALAETQLMLGQPRQAVAMLREAYATVLDGMGRYQPRSELDFLMSRAFRAAGDRDSATVYEARARRAWRDADPEVKRLLVEPEPAPLVMR